MSAIPSATPRTRKKLTPTDRAAVVAYLLSVSIALQPPKGSIQACAAKYGCSDDQISCLWRRAVQDIEGGRPINYDSGRKVKSGRKSRMTEAFREDLNRSIALILLALSLMHLCNGTFSTFPV
ncbi:uncharacterized protein PITG_08225 [Phytophthora infestans T30-4]|uniref:Uncharacterized protein n=1 Tax=Phytophthora infestans (strain T30-4) TaxID=403677 RepID=D0N9S2_PHYIT|nr:uncharacterized protein PITG_08225 [Phytophthora infestans T30-4]EEY54560.1 hypothetical protein PITG_08225 [Phytophthora infestans T30-4]|eukprot:XP_002904382.1 hypothetical protein PITG_08225 [Phytophthora infestans T30-4]